MPLTLEDFLAAEPTLAGLRREVESCEPDRRRQLRGDEAALVKLLVSRWDYGVSGWLTPDEADQVAAELIADAARQQVAARVEVRDGSLVFAGGRHGEQHLTLRSTSPVRARRHWPGYLATCPPVKRRLRDVQAMRAGAQLDLLTRAASWARGKCGAR